MQLTDEQKQKVSDWIAEGLKLSDIQNRLDTDLGVRLTYMDARLLVDDLRLTPKDPEVVPPPVPDAATPPDETSALVEDSASPAPAGKVALTVDTLTRPGSIVSGKVTFSDGQTADWHLDQYGRLGLGGTAPGYRPSPEDVAEFQKGLDKELAKLGM